MPSRMCLECGAEAVQEASVPLEVEHHGKVRVVLDRRMQCSNCQNTSYAGQQIADHESAVAAAVRDIDGLLSAEQLFTIRAKYKFKQIDMEQMLSTGPKTWTRWERGKVPQSKSTDKLIRALADDPILAHRLMQQAGVVNDEASAVFESIAMNAKLFAEISIKEELEHAAQYSADIGSLVDKAFNTVDSARRRAAMEVEAQAA